MKLLILSSLLLLAGCSSYYQTIDAGMAKPRARQLEAAARDTNDPLLLPATAFPDSVLARSELKR